VNLPQQAQAWPRLAVAARERSFPAASANSRISRTVPGLRENDGKLVGNPYVGLGKYWKIIENHGQQWFPTNLP